MISPTSPAVSRRTKQMGKAEDTLPEDDDIEASTHVSHSYWSRWQRHFPWLKRVQHAVLRIPPRCRWGFVIFWFAWKIIAGLVLLVVFLRQSESSTAVVQSGLPPTRLLYIVTTLSEYNTGTRSTVKGQDRLGEVLLPVMMDSIESMTGPPFFYQVDVVLIAAYQLLPEREAAIRDRLPAGVGLQVWDNAAPLGYELKHSKDKVIDNTRALARQHRYVVRDKLPYYDMFLAFEDDMRITGHHVQHHLQMSREIDLLREKAPETLDDGPDDVDNYKQTKFYGQMTRKQLDRVVPGLIRVEVLLNRTILGAQTQVLPIPRDFNFGDNDKEYHVDPSVCCHVKMNPNIETPVAPPADDIVIWETNVKAFSLRKLPPGSKLDWAVVMMGPGKRLDVAEKIGGYWSGREGAFGDEPKPSGGAPELVAQQGGWMATRDQIIRMNSGLCMGSFLPPFDDPTYSGDGQHSMNVEFWSGSYQFFTGVRGGCNMQRIIDMDPERFSKHLLYHVANNKQRQLNRERMVRADHMFAQLNSVQKMASKAWHDANSQQ